ARPSSSTAETEVHPSMAATQASALQAPTQPALREPRTRPAQRDRGSRGPLWVAGLALTVVASVGVAWYVTQRVPGGLTPPGTTDPPAARSAGPEVEDLVAQLKTPGTASEEQASGSAASAATEPDSIATGAAENAGNTDIATEVSPADFADEVAGEPPIATTAEAVTESAPVSAGESPETEAETASAARVPESTTQSASETASESTASASAPQGNDDLTLRSAQGVAPGQADELAPVESAPDADAQRDEILASLQLKSRAASESAFDRNALLVELRSVVDAISCQSVDLTWQAGTGNTLSVQGFVGGAADLAALRAALDRHGSSGLEYELGSLAVMAAPFCKPLALLAGQARLRDSSRARPVIQLNQLSRRYAEGEAIRATLEAPLDGYLYLDYIGPDGSVYHLLPSEEHPDNALSAGQRIVVGGNDDYEAGEPHGQNLLVAIATSQPLFSETRPFSERLDSSQSALEQALSRMAGSGVATSAYTFITTHP
ncbi:MAG: DUF4384 domain-containing protein, partial [Gammaproteobacteria bacterium]